MSALPNDSTAAPLETILAGVKDVAVLPQVVFKIMEGTSSTDTSANELERNIIIDPGFSAKVLSMANSAYFALPRRITSIKDAVQFLGFKTVRQIAMNAGVFDLFVGKTDRESMRRRTWWRHSLDTANCGRWIAGHYASLPPEEAYTAGLLHLIGKTILDRSNSEQYNLVETGIAQGIPDFAVEKHLFGCSHVEVTVGVCGQWGLPTDLLHGVEYSEPTAPDFGPSVRACVAVAHCIAGLATAGKPADVDMRSLFPDWAVESLNIADNLEQWVDSGIAAIAAANRAG
ncbi:MAG: HDOD domain-containing protein [Chthonomonas sp.]|nr:HDOD domain-containing protein [Chthonomonas sp.]